MTVLSVKIEADIKLIINNYRNPILLVAKILLLFRKQGAGRTFLLWLINQILY